MSSFQVPAVAGFPACYADSPVSSCGNACPRTSSCLVQASSSARGPHSFQKGTDLPPPSVALSRCPASLVNGCLLWILLSCAQTENFSPLKLTAANSPPILVPLKCWPLRQSICLWRTGPVPFSSTVISTTAWGQLAPHGMFCPLPSSIPAQHRGYEEEISS